MKVSFFQKNSIRCPVCESSFSREDMLTGRGRLIAGALTDQLRRLYEPSQKAGEVLPLIYTVTVCPNCFYATFPEDFDTIPEKTVAEAKDKTNSRILSVRHIFDELDFHEPRNLKEGIASYILAISSYDFFPDSASPMIKQGLASLRCGWLLEDLDRKRPNENFDYLARIMYRKARFFYTIAIEYETTGKQSLSNVKHLGPDLDKNYGYDGVLFLSSYLEFHHGPRENEEERQKALETAKRNVARIFGMGRASKDKPAILLDMARDLYNSISEYIKDEPEEGND